MVTGITIRRPTGSKPEFDWRSRSRLLWNLILGLFVSLLVFPAQAQTITTAGACSPVIQDVVGNVTVTCYGKEESNRPKFRVTYYRLGGIGQSFLLNGKLSPEWEKHLAGQQAIVNNAVLRESRVFLDRFGQEIGGTQLYGSVAFLEEHFSLDFADYAKSIDPATEVMNTDGGPLPVLEKEAGWRTYNDDLIFIPDLEAADVLFNSAQWPRSYNLLWGDWNGPIEWRSGESRISPPTLWRYLTKADLDDFEDRYRDYLGRAVGVSSSGDGEKTLRKRMKAAGFADLGANFFDSEYHNNSMFRVVESIRYLTRNGVPEKFMLVEGTKGAHYGWSFTAKPRDPQLLIAILENVSDRAIDVGTFRYRKAEAMTLRLHEESNELLEQAPVSERRLYPPGVLRPGEKLVIPVRIELTQFDTDDGYYDYVSENRRIYEQGEALRRGIVKLGDQQVAVVHDLDWLFLKTAKDFPQGTPPEVIQRYEYGPAWRMDSVEIDGRFYDFRRHDPNNFILFAGGGVGSCPYLYSYQQETGLWLEEGHFLFGATASDLRREDEKELQWFDGRLEIRETEHEVTFLDSFALKLRDADGEETIYPATSPASLSADDGDELVLAYGDRVEVKFDLPEDVWRDKTVSIVATGFYMPFSSPRLFAKRSSR